jgi:FkbM family methyltransferase
MKKLTVNGEELKLADPTNKILKKRYRTLMTKEPTTIEWMNSFEPGDIFVDIGANIGLYSVYAAIFSGCRVFSFEPQPLNFAELCKNITLNNLNEQITAYCVALCDANGPAPLYLSELNVGQSHNDFGADRAKQSDNSAKKLNKMFPDRVKLACFGYRLDTLCAEGWIPEPTHIKIDVDGFEHKVVNGLLNTLTDVQSILIEIDKRIPEHEELIKDMLSLGWVINTEQVARSLPTSKNEFNYIFYKRNA